mgnify:FL=1
MTTRAKISVDTLMISDVHLGYEFSRPQKLIETLALYDFKQLVLNGDIFDDLNFKRLNSDHWDVLSCIRQLTKTHKVVWVIGNHDGQASILSRLIGVKVHDQYIWASGGKRYLAIHGHQFDRFISKNVIIGGAASMLYNMIKKFDRGEGGAISHWIMENNRSWLRLSDEVANKASAYGKMRGVDIVFCGHTHIARQDKINGVSYYNSGCWVESPSHLITLVGKEVSLVAVD